MRKLYRTRLTNRRMAKRRQTEMTFEEFVNWAAGAAGQRLVHAPTLDEVTERAIRDSADYLGVSLAAFDESRLFYEVRGKVVDALLALVES